MKNKDKFIKTIIDGFQKNKGKASLYCFSKNIIPELIYNVLTRIFNKNKESSVLIVVDKYETRSNIIKYLKNNNIYKENDYNIKCLSADFIKEQYNYKYTVVILVGINDKFTIINKMHNESKFTLAILTENIMCSTFITYVRGILPFIDTGNLDIAIKNENIYSPVEEHRYGLQLSDTDRNVYNKYTDYINTSVSIFGSIETIEKCKKGDDKLNISATDYRHNIAYENGWREDLNVNISFIKQIDDLYNPNALLDRACNFYNMTKQRIDLVCNNDCKLETIKNICIENKNKKILIISKKGEYAATITKYINENINPELNIKCGNYHDCISDTYATDELGIPIVFKSGSNKGNFKKIGAQAQSSLNEKLFNNNSINVLSIKSASNVKLKIACDIVILTSTFCGTIIDVKRRFSNITFNDDITKVHRIYCADTIESDKLNKEKETNLFTIINEIKNDISYDEISGCIIL